MTRQRSRREAGVVGGASKPGAMKRPPASSESSSGTPRSSLAPCRPRQAPGVTVTALRECHKRPLSAPRAAFRHRLGEGFGLGGTVEGTRIEVQPMGTPTAETLVT